MKRSTLDAARAANTAPRKRGFAAMTPEQRAAIARLGGRAAHALGTAHEYTPDTARAAGTKGGRSVSRDREHMARIGRRGGEARAARMRREENEALRIAGSIALDPPGTY